MPPNILIYLVLMASGILAQNNQPTCNQDLLDRSFVTQCGPSFCEPLLESDQDEKRPQEWPASKDEVVHIVSSRGGDRFKVHTYKAIDTTEFYYEESHVNGSIFVDTQTKYQRVLGFGTTLTDSSCRNVDELPNDTRERLINDHFSTDSGIGLNLVKVPIGSSKYSYTNYVLDQPDDNHVELSPYDTDHRIPLIKDAIKAAGKFKNRFKILASSATAPPEHKDNNRLVHGGWLRKDKFNAYASYLTGFLAAYKAQGLSIWSLLVSESPVTVAHFKDANDSLDFNSMAMRPSDAAELVKALNSVRSKSEIDRYRMFLLGDNRAHIPVWADALFKSQEMSSSIAGVAYTCSREKPAPYDNLSYLTKRYPNKYLLATQGSINCPMKLGNWQYAENYATEIVKNLEFGSVGWIDFNMALNLEGGPVISDKFKGNREANVLI